MNQVLNKEMTIDFSVKIFNSVYEGCMTSEKMLCKHYKNPYKLENPIRIYMINENPVGMNAFMGGMLKLDDQLHYVLQSCDSAVLNEYRGKGIFSKIVAAQENSDEMSEFIYGFPNDKSYPGFIKMGWEKVTDLKKMFFFIKPGFVFNLKNRKLEEFIDRFWGRIVEQLLKVDLEDGEEFENKIWIDNVDYTKINEQIEYGFVRTKDFYEWKMDGNEKIKTISIRCNGKVKGYLFFHFSKCKNKESIVIDDWYAQGIGKEKKLILKKLINEVAKNVAVVEVPFVNRYSEDFKIWRQVGFLDIKFCNSIPLVVSPRGKKYKCLKRVSIKRMDTDVFMN